MSTFDSPGSGAASTLSNLSDVRVALTKYRESDTIDQTDTDVLAEFVEAVLTSTGAYGTPDGPNVGTQIEWAAYDDGRGLDQAPSEEAARQWLVEAIERDSRRRSHDQDEGGHRLLRRARFGVVTEWEEVVP